MIAVTYYRDVPNPLGFADTWPARARRLREGEQVEAPEEAITEDAYRRLIQDGAEAARAVVEIQPEGEERKKFFGTLVAQDDDGNPVTLHFEGRLGSELLLADVTRGGRRP